MTVECKWAGKAWRIPRVWPWKSGAGAAITEMEKTAGGAVGALFFRGGDEEGWERLIWGLGFG